LNVRLLQGNIPQNEKFNNTLGVDVALAWYSEQLLKAAADGVDVVVTPETAIPVLPTRLPAGYWDSLQLAFAQQTTTVGMVGVPLLTGSNGYTNSVVGLGGAAYRYDKQHLVPFGEFIPPFFRWFTDLMNIPLGDFARGDLAQPSLSHQSWRLAPNICFEDLFGEELAARFANPNSAPHVLVNISNMGWFAKPNQSSLAIDQHIGISRMRALEFDRPVIRATNTGATAIINRQGVVVQSLARGQRGVLNGTLDNRSEAITAYAQWASKFWLWPLFAWSLSVVGLALFWRRSDRF
jgi:apolipoprotein N-acyltransferase